jgi:hypothetical protein
MQSSQTTTKLFEVFYIIFSWFWKINIRFTKFQKYTPDVIGYGVWIQTPHTMTFGLANCHAQRLLGHPHVANCHAQRLLGHRHVAGCRWQRRLKATTGPAQLKRRPQQWLTPIVVANDICGGRAYKTAVAPHTPSAPPFHCFSLTWWSSGASALRVGYYSSLFTFW